MKSIDTLITDIEEVLVKGVPDHLPEDAVTHFGQNLAKVLTRRLKREERKPTLRMSNIGQPCERKLWYELNLPDTAEKLRAETYLKFLYGDLLEELILFLAEVAGHEVAGRQDEQVIEGIKGHRDAVIDGMVVDVKSASTASFKKFSTGTLEQDDPFGYSIQIQSYLDASKEDEIVRDKQRAAFLVVDKTLGHITLDVHKKKDIPFEDLYRYKKKIVATAEPPPRPFEAVPEGKSGNEKLGLNCSYCAFKDLCWPGLRTFLYSNRPVYLTRVVREPLVPELKKSEVIPDQEKE